MTIKPDKVFAKKEAPVTCGIYLYCVKNKKILVCHATHSAWTQWSIPKGLRDSGENSFSCACRELKEETGIDIEKIQVLETHALPPVKYRKQNKILESFLVIADVDPGNFLFSCTSLIDNKFPEVDSWKWIIPSAIKKYLHESQQENMGRIIELLKLWVSD